VTYFIGRADANSSSRAKRAWRKTASHFSWPTLRALAILLCCLPLAAAAQATRIVVQKGRRFTPAQITINRGESITFTNEDEFIHQMYVDGLFDSDEKNPGEKLVQPFTRAGTFEVRCHIHPKMKLVVRVN
jgi:plastocyanin